MEINVIEVKKLIKEKFRDNQKWFSEEMKVDYSYINMILHKKRSPRSPKLCNAIINYCKENKLEYKKYIFLP